MKWRICALLTGVALFAATAIPALADVGAPGTTFPEQPGASIETACGVVLASPGGGIGGVAEQNEAATAAAITSGLITDACFGG